MTGLECWSSISFSDFAFRMTFSDFSGPRFIHRKSKVHKSNHF